jgi:hypothetical protein
MEYDRSDHLDHHRTEMKVIESGFPRFPFVLLVLIWLNMVEPYKTHIKLLMNVGKTLLFADSIQLFGLSHPHFLRSTPDFFSSINWWMIF